MTDDPSAIKPEIVIVRRRGVDDGAAAKGGAWKIAYADFVTAMMAFFLVMWLINASNEETRAQVASYFNPIKLTDSSTGRRGLKDKKDNKAAQTGEGDTETSVSPPSPSDVKHEAEIMANPDHLLAAIESKLSHAKAVSEIGSNGMSGQPGGLADGIGDPFDPASDPQVQPPEDSASQQTKSQNSVSVAPREKDVPDTEHAQLGALHPQETVVTDSSEVRPPIHTGAELEVTAIPEFASGTKTQDGETEAGDSKQPISEQSRFATDIASEIAKRLGSDSRVQSASIEIKATDEGTLISLTDRQSFGMFKSGSAEPEPELVRLVETIAAVLAARPGYVVVRGHTDSKPYRNKKYDNWQLSTARAHLAQYMLVRGGLDPDRIRRIEGVADRDLKIPDDPEAPENRRIEILLETHG